MTDAEPVEPVILDGGQTILVGDAARQYRTEKTVPLRIGDRVIGTATIKDGVAECVITDRTYDNLFSANLGLGEVSIGPIPGDTEATIIPPTELENP